MTEPKKQRIEDPGIDDEDHIWEFIYDVICNKGAYYEVNEDLFKDFLKENPEMTWTPQQLLNYYNQSMSDSLYKSDISGEKQLNLFKSLGMEISNHVEKILEKRFEAVLRLDSSRRLRKFNIFGMEKNRKSPEPSSPKLPRKVPESRRRMAPDRVESKRSDDVTGRNDVDSAFLWDLELSEETEQIMWRHIARYPETIKAKHILSHSFWDEMMTNCPNLPVRSAKLFLHHFEKNMLSKVWKQDLDPKIRLNLIKDLQIPLTIHQKRYFLEKDHVSVEVSAAGFVIDWQMYDRQIEDEWQDMGVEEDVEWTPPVRNIATWTPRVSNTSSNGPSTSAAPPPPPPVPRRPSTPDQDVTIDIPTRPRSASITPPPRADIPTRSSRPASRYAPSEASRARRFPFTLDDQVKAWRHIYRSLKESKEMILLKGKAFWEEYVRRTNSMKTAGNWSSHFRKQMCPTLQNMQFSRDTMLFLFQNVDIEVDENLKAILEKKFNAKIKLGSNKRVISWKYVDDEDPEEEKEESDGSLNSTMPLDSNEAMIQIQEEEERSQHSRKSTIFKREPPRTPEDQEEEVAPRRSLRNAKKIQDQIPQQDNGIPQEEEAPDGFRIPQEEIVEETPGVVAPRRSQRNSGKIQEQVAPEEIMEEAPEAPRRSLRKSGKNQENGIPRDLDSEVKEADHTISREAIDAPEVQESVENGIQREEAPEAPQNGIPHVEEAPEGTAESVEVLEAPEAPEVEKSPKRSRKTSRISQPRHPSTPDSMITRSHRKSSSLEKKPSNENLIKSTIPESTNERERSPSHFTFQPPISILGNFSQEVTNSEEPPVYEGRFRNDPEVHVETVEDSEATVYQEPFRMPKEYFDLKNVDGRYMTETDFLKAIQKTLETCGDDAIDMMSEAVKVALRRDDFSETQEDKMTEECRQIIHDLFEKSQLSRHHQREYLSNAEELVEIVVGQVENRQVFETRIEEMKKTIQKQIDELVEKERAVGEEEE